ncbi:MAG TPA: DUF2207 domain-containing protein [Nocardioidaceae bacterium]|nr:DUF2207 domain-containing protein [Nocardioidaceae bacterium]
MWGTIGRVVGVLLAVALALVWALLSKVDAPAKAGEADPARVLDYQAVLDIDADGTLHAVEQLNVQLPSGRHGIFRLWDVHANDPHVRFVPRDIVITVNGEPTRVDMRWQDDRRYRVARVGDPDTELSAGSYLYEIRYELPGVLATEGDTSVFHWDIVGSGWAMPFDLATIDVNLPESATGVECSASCSVQRFGSRVQFTAEHLAPFSPVTARITIPGTGAEQQTLPWTPTYDAVLGRSLPTAVLWAGVSVLALLVGLMALRVTRENPPSQPLSYVPPDDVGPVQAAWILDERLPESGGIATLLYLAERRVLSIDREGDRWTLRNLVSEGEWKQVDRGSRELAFRLGLREPEADFVLDDDRSHRQLGRAIRRMQEEVERWSLEKKYIGVDPIVRVARWALVPCGVAAVVLMLVNLQRMSLVGLPFAILFVMLLGLLAPRRTRRRTEKGREVWSRAGGFRRVLSTPSSEQRFDFAGRRELYSAYLPWAMAFGCAEIWIEKYIDEMGAEPPSPTGVSLHTPSGSRVSSGPLLVTFAAAVETAIASYAAVEAGGSRKSTGAHAASSGSSSSGSVSAGSGDGGSGGGSW